MVCAIHHGRGFAFAQPQFQFCFAYMSAHAIRGLAIIVCEIDLFFFPHNVFVF